MSTPDDKDEDKNKDGFISWEEVCHRMRPRVRAPRVASSMIDHALSWQFGGPKGKGCWLPSKDEV